MDGNPYEAPQFEPDTSMWRDWFWDAIDRFGTVALLVIGYGLCGLIGYMAAWWFSS